MNFEDVDWGNAQAHLLGDCKVCGAALTPTVATRHDMQTDEVLERWEFLACSSDLSHTLGIDIAPSDGPRYTPPTTDKAD